MRPIFLSLLTVVVLFSSAKAHAVRFELFAKGSASKNFIDIDKSITSVTISSGLGVGLFSWLRLEGRYTNISSLQNRLDVQSTTLVGTISDMKTQTSIFSLGLDINFTTNEKAVVQPFIYVGGGYIETERSYYFTDAVSSTTYFVTEPKKRGFSLNGGAGFRVRLTKQLALELEAFAYAIDIETSNPLINLYGTAGVRLYL